MKADEYFKSYLAGLWDGEGSFMLLRFARRSHYKKSPNEAINYDPVASICQTINGRQEIILKQLKELYGGCLYEVPQKKGKNHKAVMFWRITSQKAAIFIRDILPHLRSKKRQAEILLRFCELRTENRRGGSRWSDPNDQLPERLALVEEIKRLNKRGIN